MRNLETEHINLTYDLKIKKIRDSFHLKSTNSILEDNLKNQNKLLSFIYFKCLVTVRKARE